MNFIRPFDNNSERRVSARTGEDWVTCGKGPSPVPNFDSRNILATVRTGLPRREYASGPCFYRRFSESRSFLERGSEYVLGRWLYSQPYVSAIHVMSAMVGVWHNENRCDGELLSKRANDVIYPADVQPFCLRPSSTSYGGANGRPSTTRD